MLWRLISEASSSSIIPPALKKKRFSNSLLEQFGDLVKEEHMGNDFPLSVEINELDSSPESVSPPRAPPFGLSSPHSPLRLLGILQSSLRRFFAKSQKVTRLLKHLFSAQGNEGGSQNTTLRSCLSLDKGESASLRPDLGSQIPGSATRF